MSGWYLILIPLVIVIAVMAVFSSRKAKATQTIAVNLTEGAARYLDRISGEAVDVASPMKQTKAQRRRRAAAVSGYVGFNGSGKSATMVRDTLPDLALGRPVLSTMAFLAPDPAPDEATADAAWAALGLTNERPEDPLALPHPLWVPFRTWDQLAAFDGRDSGGGVVVMDEVTGVADARDHMAMPKEIGDLLMQLRRRKLVLRWSTLDWVNADKRIRRASQTVNYCVGYMPTFVEGSPWPRKRMIRVRTYDARGFEDFTAATKRKDDKTRPKPLAREWARLLGPTMRLALRSYDSMASVLALTDQGLCGSCGHKQRTTYCKCAAPAPTKATGRHLAAEPNAPATDERGEAA